MGDGSILPKNVHLQTGDQAATCGKTVVLKKKTDLF
jgi:hypothetical protein